MCANLMKNDGIVMKPIYFIADLHLSRNASRINRTFNDFMQNKAQEAQAVLYFGGSFDFGLVMMKLHL